MVVDRFIQHLPLLPFYRAILINILFVRAVRLTSHNTVTSSRAKLEAIKADLVDPLIRVKEGTKDTELKVRLHLS